MTLSPTFKFDNYYAFRESLVNVCRISSFLLCPGHEVTTIEDAAPRMNIFMTTTSCRNIIRAEHFNVMPEDAIIYVYSVVRIKPQVDRYLLKNGHHILFLAEGCLINLGCATGHPPLVVSCPFSNQVLGQMALWQTPQKFPLNVHVLPRKLDEEVARADPASLNVKLTTLTPAQSKYLNVPVTGPHKPEHYYS
ncbi:hypothetical protein Clacol_004569 [Clathrus columnatus]|uniref:S-adenosyl-L-homocysteine hydrolase NAD binding domain-containing protein n=1 Tax=Clathrus columnatus TaxID=1419009 RepID=A0AAV5AAY8_9AGAM|nr:hypothetical protein Clacol_004569 [Clathrus columnatus]